MDPAAAAARAAALKIELLKAQLAEAEAQARLAAAAAPRGSEVQAEHATVAPRGSIAKDLAPPPPPPYTAEFGWHGVPREIPIPTPVLRLRGDSKLPEGPPMNVPVPKQAASPSGGGNPAKKQAISVPLPVGLVSKEMTTTFTPGTSSPCGSEDTKSFVVISKDSEMSSEMGDQNSGQKDGGKGSGKAGASTGLQPQWPLVVCSSCKTVVDKWRRMHGVKVFSEDQNSDQPEFRYTCWKCVMEREGLESEGAARSWICEHAPNFVWKQERQKKFETARAQVKETYAAMGTEVTGRKLYQLSLKYMRELFESWSFTIATKLKAMALLRDDLEEHALLRKQLAETKDPKAFKELLLRIEEIADKSDSIAFRGHTEQDAMIRAAGYVDELASTPTRSLRFWFICMGRTDYDVSRGI